MSLVRTNVTRQAIGNQLPTPPSNRLATQWIASLSNTFSSKYKIQKELGSGGYGSVFSALTANDLKVAVKIILKRKKLLLAVFLTGLTAKYHKKLPS